MKKLLKTIITGVGCTAFASVFAAAYTKPCPMGVAQGFYLGAGGGVTAQYFDYQTKLKFEEFGYSIEQGADLTKHDGSVGATVGYQRFMNNIFGWSLEFNALYNFGKEKFSQHFLTVPLYAINSKVTAEIPYQFNLVFKPSVMLSRTVFMYVPLGVSYAQLKQTLHPVVVSPVSADLGRTSKSEGVWGFITGIGVEKQVTPKFSLFAEADANFFESSTLKKTFAFETDPRQLISVPVESKVEPNDVSARVGFRYFFV